MISIIKATAKDVSSIVEIGKISVEESHRGSCSLEDMNEFLENNYNNHAIENDLSDSKNIYHILRFNKMPVGFSKIILNDRHSNIAHENVTKLDRIYLLKEVYDLKLGFELLQFNIDLSKRYAQSGMWLYTWVGNKRAVNFYLKTGFTIIGSHEYKVTETHYDTSHQMLLTYDKDLQIS